MIKYPGESKKRMKIYTKTGDKGKTSLFNGIRVSKDANRVETYGTLDELNSFLGVVCAELADDKVSKEIKKQIHAIQNDLFDIGAILADPNTDPLQQKKQSAYLRKRTKVMEYSIDKYTANVPMQKTFILPGGGKVGAYLHVARTVCRRAERRCVTLTKEVSVLPELIIYINRLSDFLFSASRFINYVQKQKEIYWKKTIV